MTASQSANLIITQPHMLIENTLWKCVNKKHAKDTDKSCSLLKDFLENVLESAVVSFQDGVFSAHVERPFLLDGILEAAVSEASDGLLETKDRMSHKCSTFTMGNSARIWKSWLCISNW